MIKELSFTKEDRIAIVAPHPDDECLGASAALLTAAAQTDVIVLTDGCRGNKARSLEEEAIVRKKQFDAEMEYVKPNSAIWTGIEDTKVSENRKAIGEIDFTPYTKIFLPWLESLHPDHRYAAAFCIDTIRRQKVKAECYSYEINAPFHKPSHFADITKLEDEKRKLIRFHEDQNEQEDITLSLNRYRAAQMIKHPDIHLAECYEQVDVYAFPEAPDLLMKLYDIHEDPLVFKTLEEQGIKIKRVMPMNITLVYDFIKDNFARSWADESMPALINGDCYVAVKDREILGFYSLEVPAKNFLGPMGVIPSGRENGAIARGLEYTALNAMKAKGYKYAISGMVHPFERRSAELLCGTVVIPDSAGSYEDRI